MPIPSGKVADMPAFKEGYQAGVDGWSWWDNPYAADCVRGKSFTRKGESWEDACLWWKGFAEQKKYEMEEYCKAKMEQLDKIKTILED